MSFNLPLLDNIAMPKGKKKPLIYRLLLPFAKFRYRKMVLVSDHPIDNEPAVFVSNHARIDGPTRIRCILAVPIKPGLSISQKHAHIPPHLSPSRSLE